MNKQLINAIKTAVGYYPELRPMLGRRARYIAALGKPHDETKTQDAYFRQIWGGILDLYRGGNEGDFIDGMAQSIEQQLTRAFRQALRDNELDPAQVETEPYAPALEEMILNEFDFVDGLASDIIAAREAETGFEQFRARAEMWSNRYNDAVNQANALIAEEEGNNLVWVYGDTDHCETCRALNGIVAKAETWAELGVYPQQPPNDVLDCGGYRCACTLEPTNKRQSPKAYDAILNAVNKG